MIEVIYLDVSPPARVPRDPWRRRWLREEQTTPWHEVLWFAGVVVERRWVLTAEQGWLWEDRARPAP